MTKPIAPPELDEFIKKWDTSPEMKKAFLLFKDLLFTKDEVVFDFNGRAGVSYSLRPKHPKQTDRNLFAMVDVIDDNPEERWLSVCFYGDMITDPREIGDLVPGGLAGDDGYCFDLDEYDEGKITYIKDRLEEAYGAAAK